MPYLLSLLGTESSIEGSDYLLCYYINDANSIKVIRLVNKTKCLSENIVLSGERILFTALPESYLEIYSPLTEGTRPIIISCKLLSINELSSLKKIALEVSN
jgi:hypothetical protein